MVLFQVGARYAVVFISAACQYCRDHADGIRSALYGISADHHVMISRDEPSLARRYRREFLSDQDTLVIPVQYGDLRSFEIRGVPTFLLVDQAKRPRLRTLGIPSKRDLVAANRE